MGAIIMSLYHSGATGNITENNMAFTGITFVYPVVVSSGA
jgi:hypothetical protein